MNNCRRDDDKITWRRREALSEQSPSDVTIAASAKGVFEPVDLLPQLIRLLTIAVPVSVRPLMLPAQALNLAAVAVRFRAAVVRDSSISSSRDAVRHVARTCHLCHDSIRSTSGNCGARAAQKAGRRESSAKQIQKEFDKQLINGGRP
jgi:hypothetical protein